MVSASERAGTQHHRNASLGPNRVIRNIYMAEEPEIAFGVPEDGNGGGNAQNGGGNDEQNAHARASASCPHQPSSYQEVGAAPRKILMVALAAKGGAEAVAEKTSEETSALAGTAIVYAHTKLMEAGITHGPVWGDVPRDAMNDRAIAAKMLIMETAPELLQGCAFEVPKEIMCPLNALGQLARCMRKYNADRLAANLVALELKLVYVTDTFRLVRMGVSKGAKLCCVNACYTTVGEIIEALPANERPLLNVTRSEEGRISKLTMTLPGVTVPMPLKFLPLQTEVYMGIASGEFDSRKAFDAGGQVESIMHMHFPAHVTYSGRGDKSMRFKGGVVTIVAPMHQAVSVQQKVDQLYERCARETRRCWAGASVARRSNMWWRIRTR